jgi:hypothetical protein
LQISRLDEPCYMVGPWALKALLALGAQRHKEWVID